MALILRNTKGSALTYTEMDANLTYLEGLTGETLSEVLANGNLTGANDISIDTGQSIVSGNGDGQIDLDVYGNANSVMISSDNGVGNDMNLFFGTSGPSNLLTLNNIDSSFGTCSISMAYGQIDIHSDNSVYINSGIIVDDLLVHIGNGKEVKIEGLVQIGGNAGGGNQNIITDNSNNVISTNDLVLGGTIVSARNSQIGIDSINSSIIGGDTNEINTLVINSVIIGGENITATEDNTAYMQNSVNTGVSQFAEYTVSTVPTASDYSGGMIAVTDETGGYTLAFSDGTDWRRMRDSVIIS